MAKARKHTVSYERARSGWWVATLRGVPGVHTQGRTIEEARRRVREALAAALDLSDADAQRADLVDER